MLGSTDSNVYTYICMGIWEGENCVVFVFPRVYQLYLYVVCVVLSFKQRSCAKKFWESFLASLLILL